MIRALRPEVAAFGAAVCIGVLAAVSPVAAVGIACLVCFVAISRHRQIPPVSALAVAFLAVVLLPDLRAAPPNIRVAGIALYIPHLLLPVLVIGADLTRIRGPIRVALGVYIALLGYMAGLGFLTGASTVAILQDLRGPLTFLGGFFAATVLYARHGLEKLLRLVPWILGPTVLLIAVQLFTGSEILGGRVRGAVGFGGIGQAGTSIDATRFIVNGEDLAVASLLMIGWIFVQKESVRARAMPLLITGGSALIIVVFSLSRQLLVGLFIGVLSWFVVRGGVARTVRVGLRFTPVLAVLALLLVLATIGGVGAGSDSVLGRQIDGFSERVIGGLTSESRSNDAGSNWRTRENELALQSLSEKPLGTGLGQPYRDEFSIEAFGDPTFFRRWVHNVYLWYATKGGYLGLIAVASVSLLPMVVALRRSYHHRDPMAEVAFSVLAAFAVMSLVDPVIVNSNTGALTGAICAVLAITHRRTVVSSPRHRSAGELARVPGQAATVRAD